MHSQNICNNSVFGNLFFSVKINKYGTQERQEEIVSAFKCKAKAELI
jgi:hypothetical protein